MESEEDSGSDPGNTIYCLGGSMSSVYLCKGMLSFSGHREECPMHVSTLSLLVLVCRTSHSSLPSSLQSAICEFFKKPHPL